MESRLPELLLFVATSRCRASVRELSKPPKPPRPLGRTPNRWVVQLRPTGRITRSAAVVQPDPPALDGQSAR